MKTKRELVIELLKKNVRGLTIIEISRSLNISRNTAAIILAELKGAQSISVRPVGKAKMHYWEGK